MSIPSQATARVTSTHSNGIKHYANYYLRHKLVGTRSWYDNGQIETEFPYRKGVWHGVHKVWHRNGRLFQRVPYVNGKEHGIIQTWDQIGRLLDSYRMSHGTGALRFWADSYSLTHGSRKRPRFFDRIKCPWHLSMEMNLLHRVKHGPTRFWKGKRLVAEHHFQYGRRYGVWRAWDKRGRLERGYPLYFLRGAQVTKRQYLKAQKTNPSLPQ